jgi:hypothetical protein
MEEEKKDSFFQKNKKVIIAIIIAVVIIIIIIIILAITLPIVLNKEKQNCEVSDWSEWSACINGKRNIKRTVSNAA